MSSGRSNVLRPLLFSSEVAEALPDRRVSCRVFAGHGVRDTICRVSMVLSLLGEGSAKVGLSLEVGECGMTKGEAGWVQCFPVQDPFQAPRVWSRRPCQC